MTTLLVVALIFLALVGTPIFVILAGFAIIGLVSMGYDVDSATAGGLLKALSLATGAEGTTLSTIPLFTLMGYVMAESKTASRLVAFAQALVGWIPGGLALVTIVACAIFTTFTGASGVTIVAIGGLLLPALTKEKYKERFSLGLITATGSIGLMFPPALPLIVYGIVYGMSAQATVSGSETGALELVDFSLDRFLFAGLLPGLVLVSMVGAYAMYVAWRSGVPREKATPETIRRVILTLLFNVFYMVFDRKLRPAVPEILVPILIIVTLATGWLQIPEAAAVAALYVVAIEVFLYKDIKLRHLPKIAREAMGLVGAIFIVIVAAKALTGYFIDADVPGKLYLWLTQYIESKWTFLLALNILLLIVGCLMDIFSAIVVVVPLITPVAKKFGVDPYHLGVVFLLNLEIGYLTPPVGLNLFITSFRFEKPIIHVYKSALPFLFVMLGALMLVTYVEPLTPIRSNSTQEPEQAQAPPPGEAPDAGPAAQIVWPDGGVWTPERCEAPEIKDDPLGYLECTSMFELYARCDGLPTELDKLECQMTVREGENPFADEEDDEDFLDEEGHTDDAGVE